MKAGAPTPELLKSQPELPQEFTHLVDAIRRFVQPLDWAAFEAWARMTRRTFARWELDVIAHLDRKRQS